MTTDVDQLLNRDAHMRDFSTTYGMPLRLNNGVLETDLPDEDIAEEAPPVGNEQAPVTDGSQAPGFIDSVKNVGTNIGDIPDMMIRGILRAGGEAAFSSGLIDEDTANKWRGMLDASG